MSLKFVISHYQWNKLITAPQGKPLFNNLCCKKFLKIIDLLSDSDSFLPRYVVKEKYKLNDTHILLWLGLINSIPLAWRTKIKEHFSDSQHIGKSRYRSLAFTSKSYNSPEISRTVFRKVGNRSGRSIPDSSKDYN